MESWKGFMYVGKVALNPSPFTCKEETSIAIGMRGYVGYEGEERNSLSIIGTRHSWYSWHCSVPQERGIPHRSNCIARK